MKNKWRSGGTVDTADSKSVAERREGSSPSFATSMKAQNVWQQAIDKINEIKSLVEGDSDETVEYYNLLEELNGYRDHMSDDFQEVFDNELSDIIAFEKGWRASFESEKKNK